MLAAQLPTGDFLIRNQKWRLRNYSNVFVGREAVTWAIAAGLCPSRAAAVLMFDSLLNSGFIEHVPKKMSFRDAFFFYTWNGAEPQTDTPPAINRSLTQPTPPTFARLLSSGDEGRAKIHEYGGSRMQDPSVLQELVSQFVRACGLGVQALQHSGYVERQMRFKVVPRYCLLLFKEAVVLCMSLREGSELCMKHLLHLEKVTPLEKTSKSFCINTPTKNFVFIVRTMEERDTWMSKLKAAVLHLRKPSSSPLDDAIIQLQSLVDCKLSQEEQAKRISAVINLLSISRAKQFHNIREETMSKVEDKDVLLFLESTFLPPMSNQITLAHEKDDEKAPMAMEIAMAFVVHLLRPLEKTRKINARCRRTLLIEGLKQEYEDKGIPLNEAFVPPKHLDSQQTIEYNLWTFTTTFTLRKIDRWDFDIFRLDACTHGRPLSTLMFHIFSTYDLFTRYNIRPVIFCNWILELEKGYINNPYHNRVHAADVVQNSFFFLRQSPFLLTGLTQDPPDPGMLCALLAAAMHDYRHPGSTNAYLCATEDDIASTYNHISVLESMHCAEAFRLMKRPELNILEFFPPKLKAEVRETVVTMVLSTDMKKHFDLVQRLHQDDCTPGQPKARVLQLESVLHCADLGNPTKARHLMLQWTKKVFEEFYEQGDMERKLGLPISQMMDRTQPAVEKSQIGFIDFIVKPLYKQFTMFCPEAEICLSNLQHNKEYWQSQIALMDQKSGLSSPSSASTPNLNSPSSPLNRSSSSPVVHTQ